MNLQKANWVFKLVEDSDNSSINLELIFNFYDEDKVEININQFTSFFGINLDSYFAKSCEEDSNTYPNQFNHQNHLSSNIGPKPPKISLNLYADKYSEIATVEETDKIFNSSNNCTY